MDMHSPRGQANERHTERCWSVILDHFSVLSVTRQRLADDHPADGVLRWPDRKPCMLVEIKSRSDFDEQTFWQRHRGTWLISNHKIVSNVPIARKMGVPFVGAMHIVRSRVVLLKTIFDGTLCDGIEVRKCETQATINGGRKIIDNAFVPMHDALVLRY